MNLDPLLGRSRPACLDIPWAPGTGLIWKSGETVFYENPRNRFMRFRKAFACGKTVRRAELRLFADTHYVAWMNGRFIGRGPWRSDPTWTYYDVIDVTDFLRPGHNVLAVLCLFQGFGTGSRISIMQGLLAHLEIETSDGSRSFVVSDRSWKVSPAEEFIRPTPRLHGPLGCVEVQDLALQEHGWQEPGFDDSGWEASDYVKADLAVTPWYHFVPNDLPSREGGHHEALPLVGVSCGEAVLPPETADLGGPRRVTGTGGSANLPLELPGDPRVRVVDVDFGEIAAGLLRLEVAGCAGAVADVLFAEELIDRCVPQPPQARVLTARFILRGGEQTLEVAFNWLAFRHAQLWIYSAGPFALRRAWLDTLAYPLPPVPGFDSDDGFLNQLDAACEHTLRLCSQDGIVDSASREQQQWIGDARETALTLHHRFPVAPLHRRLIEQIGQGMDWMGSLVPRYPSGNRNVSPIPFYSLQWIRSFEDYWWFTGDRELIAQWWPNILHALRWFSAFVNGDGLLERVPHWMYIELGEGPDSGRLPGTGAINTSLNLVYLDALRCVRGLGRLIGDDRFGAELEAGASKLRASLQDKLWDESAGAYPDAWTPGSGAPTVFSEGTSAHALLHLEAPGSERACRLLQCAFDNPLFVRASPFAMNFVLRALDYHGHTELGLRLIAGRYGGFVRTGTTWEHWAGHHKNEAGFPMAHSFSHAWGAAPLAFFVRSVCGIRPQSPGWGSVLIRPHLCHLQRASVGVRTPLGDIRASWEMHEGRLEGTVDLPEGIRGAYALASGEEIPLSPGCSRVIFDR